MKIYIVKETTIDEKRVSLVPDVAKKFVKDGFDVFLEKDAGYMSKFTDEDYSSLGVNIDDNYEVILTPRPIPDTSVEWTSSYNKK